MRIIGNLLWWLFGGLEAAIGYFTGSLALACTIIGIPFAIQTFKIGLYQYALETKSLTCLGILCAVIEIESSGRIQSCLLCHLFIDFDGWLLFPHGV